MDRDPRRPQVDVGALQAPTIRPVASPVDTFVRPPAYDKVDQLGAALTQVSPELKQFTGAVANDVDSNAQEAGKQAAEKLRQEGETLASATRKGLLPANQNPWYMAGLREQLGRNMADQYEGDLRGAMAQDENLQQSTNLNDFDAFAKKFRSQWQQQNIGSGDQDQHFNTGFMFRSGAYEDQLRNEFASGIEEKVKTQGDEATHQEVVGAIQHGITNGLPLSQVADGINQMADDLVKQGRNGSMVNKAVALAVHDAAVADPLHSKDILGMLGSLNGKAGPLSTTSYGMALTEQAQGAVSEKLQRQYSLNHEQAAAQKLAGENTVFAQVNDALDKAGDDAHNVDMRPFKEMMNKISPDKVQTIDNMQTAWVAHDIKEDPNVADHLYVNMYTKQPGDPDYVSEGSIAGALGAKQISTATFKSLMSELHERDKPEKQVTNDRFFTMIPSIIKSDIVNNTGDSQENQIRANTMSLQVQREFIKEFSGKNGSQFDAAKNEFIQKWRGQILDPQGTPEERKRWLSTPNLNTPAQPVDWHTEPVVPKQTLRQLRQQMDEVQQSKRSRLDTPLMRVLKANGIKPDAEHVIDFIVNQQALFDRGKTYSIQP